MVTWFSPTSAWPSRVATSPFRAARRATWRRRPPWDSDLTNDQTSGSSGSILHELFFSRRPEWTREAAAIVPGGAGPVQALPPASQRAEPPLQRLPGAQIPPTARQCHRGVRTSRVRWRWPVRRWASGGSSSSGWFDWLASSWRSCSPLDRMPQASLRPRTSGAAVPSRSVLPTGSSCDSLAESMNAEGDCRRRALDPLGRSCQPAVRMECLTSLRPSACSSSTTTARYGRSWGAPDRRGLPASKRPGTARRRSPGCKRAFVPMSSSSTS